MTDDTPIREPEQIWHDCARTHRAIHVSDQFQAILGCLIGQNGNMPCWIQLVHSIDYQENIYKSPKSMRLNALGVEQ